MPKLSSVELHTSPLGLQTSCTAYDLKHPWILRATGEGEVSPLAMHICAVDSGWIERQTKYREQLVKVASILLKAAHQGTLTQKHMASNR